MNTIDCGWNVKRLTTITKQFIQLILIMLVGNDICVPLVFVWEKTGVPGGNSPVWLGDHMTICILCVYSTNGFHQHYIWIFLLLFVNCIMYLFLAGGRLLPNTSTNQLVSFTSHQLQKGKPGYCLNICFTNIYVKCILGNRCQAVDNDPDPIL